MKCILQNQAMLKFGLVCTECRGLGPTTPRTLLDFGEVAAQITIMGINSVWLRILNMNGMTTTVRATFLSSAIKVTVHPQREILQGFVNQICVTFFNYHLYCTP